MTGQERSDRAAESDQGARRAAFRVVVAALATSLLVLRIGILAVIHLLTLQHQPAELLEFEVASLRAAEEMAVSVRQAEIQVHRFLVSGDAENLNALMDLKRRSEKSFQLIKELGRTEEEGAIIDRMETVRNDSGTK